ncbi:MAG: aminoacyl-tRNA hydrolase [Candidatus Levybacteria bacterium]|nr:aminoacyl-tRNA hydrolase [Candidatus Levybacteria bacterium]
MKLIVGLGNPGEKYEKTRHNLGFLVLEQFLKNFSEVKNTVWDDKKKFKSNIAEIGWNSRKRKTLEKVILAKPQTYMNNSGMAVSLLASFYKIKPEDIWIIHDEIDLPVGAMKIRLGGSAAGHHGIDSIIKSLETDKFWRFRLGIGHSKGKEKIVKTKIGSTTDFVLGNFSGAERSKMKVLIKKAVRALETGLEEDLRKAMNQFNTK